MVAVQISTAFSRRLLVALTAMILLATLLFLMVILSYATLLKQARQVPELQNRLVTANAQLVRVQELNRELEEMRDVQERILTMLGVGQMLADTTDDGSAESVDPLRARLGEVAGVIMTPPPDVWPLAGQVTREYVYANGRLLAILDRVPEPANDPLFNADMDGDGAITIEDYLEWYFNHFQAGDVSREVTGDGIMDQSDASVVQAMSTPSNRKGL